MKKILVIEDETPINKIISYNLVQNGFEVFSAYNGKDGLELYDAHKPDLILLDIMMPIMDGNNFCVELKKIYPDNKTPIIVMTAKHDSYQVLQSFSTGVADYITKPFTIDMLIDLIKKHIEDSEHPPTEEDYKFFR